MYRISVPIFSNHLKQSERNEIVKQLNRLNAERVFLALDLYEQDPIKQKNMFEKLADNCRFFRENGFEVGAWLWTFWMKDNKRFRNMRSIQGTEIKEFICPTDEEFVKFASDYVESVARCGVQLIQFDDDFRYGFLSDSPACLCDAHIREINRMTGTVSTREELMRAIICGGKNQFRSAYLQANGDAFRKFAKTIRQAVDRVDPTIRVGACACMTSWDIDGTNAVELAYILAGQTKPFLRLIGAPYWAVDKSWGNCLQDVVELERMEGAWTKSNDIEIMAEGDVFPRPRTTCPANYLEGFDTAIRVSGCTDGILKYGIDYYSNADYECGYATFHERNRELYSQITQMFGSKASCGVRVYETMNKIEHMVMPTKVNTKVNIEDLFFSKAARTLAYNTIPTVYEGSGVCGIVFDENARNLPAEALEHGLILDLAAAEILTERGIDVGIKTIGRATGGECERFIRDDNHILTRDAVIYEVTLNKKAEILSDAETPGGTFPVSYRYENANGNRFLVLNINTRSKKDNLLKHYARSRQYAEIIPWLGGQKLPAYLYGNPALYIQCKQDETALAVGLWNFFADPVLSPVVQLVESYSEVTCINCNGRIEKNQVFLSEIPPFGFVGFEVKK